MHVCLRLASGVTVITPASHQAGFRARIQSVLSQASPLTLIQVLRQLTEERTRRVSRINLVADLMDSLAFLMLNVSCSIRDEECRGDRRLLLCRAALAAGEGRHSGQHQNHQPCRSCLKHRDSRNLVWGAPDGAAPGTSIQSSSIYRLSGWRNPSAPELSRRIEVRPNLDGHKFKTATWRGPVVR